jgi:hypothetical protein
VRQRQHAVRVWAVRFWVPSSGCGGAASVVVCVAVATSIVRSLSQAGGGGHSLLMMQCSAGWLLCGEIDTHGHHHLCRVGPSSGESSAGGETSERAVESSGGVD